MRIDPAAVAAELAPLMKTARERMAEDPALVERAARAVILCEKIARGWRGVGSKAWEGIDERTRRALCDEVAAYLLGKDAPLLAGNLFAGQVVDEVVRTAVEREDGKRHRAAEKRKESTPYSRARARSRLAAVCSLASAQAGKAGRGSA